MKKIVIVITVLIALIGIFALVGAQFNESSNEDELVIGMSGGYKPYTFTDETGELIGFEVDTWNEIAKRIGKEIRFETADFSGLFGLLDSGKITTISNQITVNEKRLEKCDFTVPYVYYGAQLVVKSDNETILNLETLKGKKVGVSLGSNYEEMIKHMM
jgi:putative amino-acid transport system substrate-binding protein/putative amino-acid transport system permease protein